MQLTGHRGKAGLTTYPLIQHLRPRYATLRCLISQICARDSYQVDAVYRIRVSSSGHYTARSSETVRLEHPLKTDTGTSRLPASTINVIELLLDAGADINDPYRHWSDKSCSELPLYLALISNVEVAKFLTRGALCDVQCLDFTDDNFGIDLGMAELAKTLLPEHVRLKALKRSQKIAKGRL
jgi:hypothetical protein